jgi:hypothetical protein
VRQTKIELATHWRIVRQSLRQFVKSPLKISLKTDFTVTDRPTKRPYPEGEKSLLTPDKSSMLVKKHDEVLPFLHEQ